MQIQSKLKLLGVVIADAELTIDYDSAWPDDWSVLDVELIDDEGNPVSLDYAASTDSEARRKNRCILSKVESLLDDDERMKISEMVWESVRVA